MKQLFFAIAICALSFANTITAQTTIVGGELMFPQKNIVENALNSKDHTTLVAAVKAAGLVDALVSKGPFTVFAPTNDAFENLPEGTVATLLKPENKALLTKILTYHVVAGQLDAASLRKKLKKEKSGTLVLTTLAGSKLTVVANGSNLMLKDENGGTANISVTDVMQSNGVIHVVDSVVTPK